MVDGACDFKIDNSSVVDHGEFIVAGRNFEGKKK